MKITNPQPALTELNLSPSVMSPETNDMAELELLSDRWEYPHRIHISPTRNMPFTGIGFDDSPTETDCLNVQTISSPPHPVTGGKDLKKIRDAESKQCFDVEDEGIPSPNQPSSSPTWSASFEKIGSLQEELGGEGESNEEDKKENSLTLAAMKETYWFDPRSSDHEHTSGLLEKVIGDLSPSSSLSSSSTPSSSSLIPSSPEASNHPSIAQQSNVRTLHPTSLHHLYQQQQNHDGINFSHGQVPVQFPVQILTQPQLQSVSPPPPPSPSSQSSWKAKSSPDHRNVSHSHPALVKQWPSTGTRSSSTSNTTDIHFNFHRRRQRQSHHPLTVEGELSRILAKLMKHRWSYVFNSPVDPVALNLPDYFDIIKHPMDLRTVKTKLHRPGTYKTVADFCKDVNLVWINALNYNPKGTDVYIMAATLQKYFMRLTKAFHHSQRLYTTPSVDLQLNGEFKFQRSKSTPAAISTTSTDVTVGDRDDLQPVNEYDAKTHSFPQGGRKVTPAVSSLSRHISTRRNSWTAAADTIKESV